MDIVKIYADEHEFNKFDIFEQGSDPYSSDKPIDSIELCEATYIGGKLFMIPMQIYRTDNPLLLQAVCLISELHYETISGAYYGEIRGNNIRVIELTCDGMARYDDNGHRSPPVWELKPHRK